jgi:hypothetical protein
MEIHSKIISEALRHISNFLSSWEVANYIPTSCWFEKNQFLTNVFFTKWRQWYTQSCIFLKFFTNFFQKKRGLRGRQRSTFSTLLEVEQLFFNFRLKFWKIWNLEFWVKFSILRKKKLVKFLEVKKKLPNFKISKNFVKLMSFHALFLSNECYNTIKKKNQITLEILWKYWKYGQKHENREFFFLVGSSRKNFKKKKRPPCNSER